MPFSYSGCCTRIPYYQKSAKKFLLEGQSLIIKKTITHNHICIHVHCTYIFQRIYMKPFLGLLINTMIIFSSYSENLDSVKRYKTKHTPTQHV